MPAAPCRCRRTSSPCRTSACAGAGRARGRDADRAGGAERMAQRDRAAHRVDLGAVEAEVLDHRQRLRGEGFVELDPVDLVRLMPAALQRRGIASIGPMPMISGGTPATAKPTKRASGFRLYSLDRLLRWRAISAPAPSEVCELLPAVTLPPLAANTGFSLASASHAWCRGAGLRRADHLRVSIEISPAGEVGVAVVDLDTARSRRLNSPAACAASAPSWCAAANASCASRLTFHCCATFSAVRPMP